MESFRLLDAKMFSFKIPKYFLCNYFLYLLPLMPKSRFGITLLFHTWIEKVKCHTWSRRKHGSQPCSQPTMVNLSFHPILVNPIWWKGGGRRPWASKELTRAVVFDRGSPTYKLISWSFKCRSYVGSTEPSSQPSRLNEGQGWTDLFKTNFQT